MAIRKEEVDNPMVLQKPWKPVQPMNDPRLLCDCCGCYAKVKVRGNILCWDCAEDEGVKIL